MKEKILFLSLSALLAFLPEGFSRTSARRAKFSLLDPSPILAASPQPAQPAAQAATDAKKPQWKSRAEYDAFAAMAKEKDPKKRIQLAEAFIKKYPNSDFKANAYVAIMQSYQQLGDSAEALHAAKNVLQSDPNDLPALSYLSFAFPFVFKSSDPNAATELSNAEANAKHGLEVLQKFQKPAKVSEDQYKTYVKQQNAIFNSTLGFVALQNKDYANAISRFKVATKDNPSDFYSFYRMGLAYLFSTPHDYDHAIWYMARAVSLAKSAKDPNAEAFEKYLKQTYISHHGNDQGLSDIIAQAAASPNPPEGFNVAVIQPPKPTGNKDVDAFNELTFPLTLGGPRADQQWAGIKGKPVELHGFVDSVEKGSGPDTYLVRIDILEQSKATPGVYDIEIRDTTQPKVRRLKPGDPVAFKGTLVSYTTTPNVMLTLDGQITSPLPEETAAPRRRAPARRHRK